MIGHRDITAQILLARNDHLARTIVELRKQRDAAVEDNRRLRQQDWRRTVSARRAR